MKKLLLLLLALPVLLVAQPKAGYYDDAVGKSEAALKTALYGIINDHIKRDYKDLWTDFQSTDKRADGKVWDMYSNCNFTFGTHQDSGSGVTAECQYYNREHSFPKSWFKDGDPMYTDLFHLYPTDKYINSERGNYPYGETNNPTKTYNNGSKKGNCTFPGYTGIIFEPINEYKGDFARTYFYMVTRYDDVVDKWNLNNSNASPHLNSTKYPAFNEWSVQLLMKWHRQDPVSTKEINRNNAVEKIQDNRNPFIDYPLLAEYIWGNMKGEAWSITSGVDALKIEFSVSPNPVQSKLNIQTNEQDVSYSIYNLNGQLLMNNSFSGNTGVAVDMLQNGMYLIKLSKGERNAIQKFIVNR